MFVRSLISFFLLSSFASAGIIQEVRLSISQNNFPAAESQLKAYRDQRGIDPEYLEALSWMGRGALAAGRLDQAQDYARTTEKQTISYIKTRKLDSDPHLGIALGAALEVEAQSLAQQNKRAEAVTLLKRALAKYGNSSIRVRLQKNVNILSLSGQPAPTLEIVQHLGPQPVALGQLKGSPVLLFFWAHWCSDCKAEAPIMARLHSEYKDLNLIGPTQLYGYTARGEEAAPAQELAYIDSVRQKFYASLADMPVPVSQANFNAYGASTTPTIVLLDRAGKVALYHPGAMPYEELHKAIADVLRP
ncbi:MAG TPA: redoxin family protein [Candidatus Saccharimonadales bacterium]|jgi:thiol-disulfide isomerase/thioredoxin|nr:redoxin family protein [Candidatus Saccharimonadales bacterium]